MLPYLEQESADFFPNLNVGRIWVPRLLMQKSPFLTQHLVDLAFRGDTGRLIHVQPVGQLAEQGREVFVTDQRRFGNALRCPLGLRQNISGQPVEFDALLWQLRTRTVNLGQDA